LSTTGWGVPLGGGVKKKKGSKKKTPHNCDIFLDYVELKDGTGFTIDKTGNLIYPFDPHGGWYDLKGNYYIY